MQATFPSDNTISYHGPINIDLISFVSNYIKQHIVTNAANIGKIYKIFIELTQNVSYYSARQFNPKRSFGSGIGWFKVEELEDKFLISTGNIILNEHGPLLVRNSNEINSLTDLELRELKRKTRSTSNIKDIGAHIGLIQTGLISGNDIDLSVEPINETHSFFTITARINKILHDEKLDN